MTSLKGKTYEEIMGVEKARELKELRRKKCPISGTKFKGKTYDEIYGIRATQERKKRSIAKLGDKNPMWKGNDVGYGKLHVWVRTYKPMPEFCEECKKAKPYDLANKNGNYTRDFDEWEYLCRRCHMKKDGRLEKFKKEKK